MGLLDGLDINTGEIVVASTLDQQMGARIWARGLLWSGVADEVVELLPRDPTGIVDEVMETLLKGVVSRLLEDVDEDLMEDSTALASAFETFAFALAKLVIQTFI